MLLLLGLWAKLTWETNRCLNVIWENKPGHQSLIPNAHHDLQPLRCQTHHSLQPLRCDVKQTSLQSWPCKTNCLWFYNVHHGLQPQPCQTNQSLQPLISDYTMPSTATARLHVRCRYVNPLGPHDALKHHITSLKTDLIVLQLRVFEQKFPWNWFSKTWQFSLIFHPLQVIFIHYKSWIATSIRGLQWMRWQWWIQAWEG